MAIKLLFVLFNLILSWNIASSARVLCIYPVPFNSHQSVFQIVTEELAKRGHKVVTLTPLPHSKPIENVTEIDVHNISYTMWDEGYNKAMKHQNGFTIDPINFWAFVYDTIYSILEAQYNAPEMQRLLKDDTQHFDLIFAEACIRPSLIASARFKAPIILVSSFYGNADNFYTLGGSIDPIFFPEYNIRRVVNLSFWDKLHNLYTGGRLRLMEMQMEKKENEMIKKIIGKETPTIRQLQENIELLLLNVHHIWDDNRPVPPSVMYLGALHLKEPKPLSENIKKYLDNSKHGVIYMSLGSKIKSSNLPKQTLQSIIEVFESLPYDILWKWDADELKDKPKNVRLEKWLPQNDLLHHPKIKGFISQGGLQSTDEAIAANVPLIGLPVFADQHMNVQKYQRHEIGFYFNVDHLDKEQFRRAILAITEDNRYRRNVARLSRIMKQQRAGALDRAMDWVDFVAKHGSVHLRSPLANLSFVEYYVLDVIIPVTLVTVLAVALTVYFSYHALKRLNIILLNSTKIKKH